jgi:exocyst complex component 5
LKKFYLTIEKRVETLSSSLESDQGEVNLKVSSLAVAFDEVFENFTNLNQVSEKISGTALRIGKQLESIQMERNRAEAAKEILGLFLEYNSTLKCSKIDTLLINKSFESRLKLASLLRKLNHIAKADIPGAENVRNINIFQLLVIMIIR